MNDNNTGGSITEGAIVQHLAKTRIRMVEEELPVPPPLRRGGKARISTGPKALNRHAGVEKASRRRATPSSPKSGAAVDKKNVAVIVKAKGKKKGARKINDDDDDSDDDGECDEESGDGTWMPRSEQSKSMTKVVGQPTGKIKKTDDSSVDETMSQSDKAADEGEHSRMLIESIEHEGDGDDSDDHTLSNASGGFVGNNARFLPAESVASDTDSSKGPEAFMITLHLGKANARKVAMLAGANVHQTDSGQYHAGKKTAYISDLHIGDAVSRYAVAPYKPEYDEETEVLEDHTFSEESPTSPFQSTNNTALAISGGAGDLTAAGRLRFGHPDIYEPSMGFGPASSEFPSSFAPTTVNPQFDVLGAAYYDNQLYIPQHDHWHLGTTSGLVQTPAAIEYPSMPAGSFADSNHGADGANVNFGLFDYPANAHTYVHGGYSDLGLPRFGTNYTDTTHSSSTKGSLSTDTPGGIFGAYHPETVFETAAFGLDAKEHVHDQLDEEDAIEGLGAHNEFEFDFL